MAFDKNKNKHAVASKILKKLGYNNAQEMLDNVAVWETTGAPDATVHTGVVGNNMIYNRIDGTVYLRTGAASTPTTAVGPSTAAAAVYYVRIL
jgi:ABC-type proline/glycine betaine transport system substrate-binding protein